MATARPFAYNTGSTILGTTQIGSLAVGTPTSGFTGNPKWWNGPDEDLGYVICRPNTNGNQPNPDNVPAYIRFSRSILKTDQSFINLVNSVFNQTFTTTTECTSYLTTNGYWTSFVGGGGFVPGDFDFVFLSGTRDDTNTVTFTKTGSLYLQLDVTAEPEEFTVVGWVNGQSIQNVIRWYTTQADAISYKQTVAISNFGYYDPIATGYAGGRPYAVIDIVSGSTMYFNIDDFFGSGYDPGVAYGTSLSFKNGGFAGTVVDTLVGFKSAGCYLTTTMVQYKGLLDDGPELIAMRQLREHYRGDAYYDNGLIEYYANSQSIIDGINASVDPSIDYEFIYQSVLKVKNYVDQSMWKEAIDEYIDTYFILKNRYI